VTNIPIPDANVNQHHEFETMLPHFRQRVEYSMPTTEEPWQPSDGLNLPHQYTPPSCLMGPDSSIHQVSFLNLQSRFT
jgi:hypothetical protein